jgi:AraC-like DNA-binding protein
VVFEKVEVRRPQLPIRRQPLVELRERLRPDAVQAALRIGARLDEPGVLQDAEVLGHGRLAEPEVVDQLSDRPLALTEQIEDSKPPGLAKDLECRCSAHVLLLPFGYMPVKKSTMSSTAKSRLASVTPVAPERHLLRAKDLVDARFREALDVGALARAAYLSPAHFSREFRRAFGETPHQYLLTRRLERAAALLRNTDRSVADICFTVGLRSVGSFTTSFRRVYGMSPTAYRATRPPLERALVPTCVLQAYARPHGSSFREDSNAA